MKKHLINTKFLTVISLIGILLLSGCTGKDTSQENPNEDNTATTTTTDSSPSKHGTVQSVHFSKLIEFLPESPSGWTSDEPQGSSYTVESGSWSMASKSYTKGDTGKADVVIMDSAYYNVGFFQAWKSFVQWESTEGYYKTTTVKGFPAFETYSKSSQQYGKYININDRFMVYITSENDDKNALNSFENSIDYNGIKSLS